MSSYIGYALVILSLLWCSGSMQVCSNSTTNYTIEVNFYKNDTGTIRSDPMDIIVDSSNNQYLMYTLAASDSYRITKIASDGNYIWTQQYNGVKHYIRAQLSSDETVLRIYAKADEEVLFGEVYTSNFIFEFINLKTLFFLPFSK